MQNFKLYVYLAVLREAFFLKFNPHSVMYRSWLDVCTESDTFLFVFLVLIISRTARISLTKTENHVEVIKTSKQPDRDAKVRKNLGKTYCFL